MCELASFLAARATGCLLAILEFEMGDKVEFNYLIPGIPKPVPHGELTSTEHGYDYYYAAARFKGLKPC